MMTKQNIELEVGGRGKKLIFNVKLEYRRRKTFILLFIVIFIAGFWYIEKTKLISEYGIIFYKMGLLCDDTCGEDEPLQYFQKAVRHNPNLSAAHYQLALIYEKRGDYNKSLNSFRRVTELNHGNFIAFYKIGLQYFKKSDYENALRYFLQSYAGRDRPDDVIYYLARIYDDMEDYDLAIWYYHYIVSLQPKFASKVYPRLAEIYYFHRDEDAIYYKIGQLQSTSYYSPSHRGLPDQLKQSFERVQALEASKTASD